MPKVTSQGGPALRRNQACRQCRKRKLKCDAARPHCGTCTKQWKAQIAVPPPPGYSHPAEPACTYDPVEGMLVPESDPLDRIRSLESQINELKNQLSESSPYSASTRRAHSSASPPVLRSTSTASPSPPFQGAPSPPMGTEYPATLPPILLPHAGLELDQLSPIQSFNGRTEASTSPMAASTSPIGYVEPDSYLDVLYHGWNPDLPDPATLHHHIDVFFNCDPCGSRILHKPSLLANLALPPSHPDFPHPALLHAICASASRWMMRQVDVRPDGQRRDRFAEFHAGRTRSYIDKAMSGGANIFEVLQACVILSWYFYAEGRWVEVWIFAGFQTRVAVPMRLNYPGTFSSQGMNTPGAYLPPPKNVLEMELRRRAWWMSVMFDRIVSVGGWMHGVDERDIGTEFPLRKFDFDNQTGMESNPQDMWTNDVLITHHPNYTDSWLLFIKAVMSFGKVTDYNVRTNLRNNSRTMMADPRLATGFLKLDKLLAEQFLLSLPPPYNHCLGPSDGVDGSIIDTDLYMAHLVPHAAVITLHNPYMNFKSQSCPSVLRCLKAARSILAAYYLLTGTSFVITRLHPFATICWYLAAVVQVQLCKHLIEVGDSAGEEAVWGEINVLRFAMLEYGGSSPIGTRQEKLLQGLMTEIVRMTSQSQPLAVGVPLYPFSHAGVFHKSPGEETAEDVEATGAHIAPLPDVEEPESNHAGASPASMQGDVDQHTYMSASGHFSR